MSCAKEVLPIIEANTMSPVMIVFFIFYLFNNYTVFVRLCKGRENLPVGLYKKFGWKYTYFGFCIAWQKTLCCDTLLIPDI